MADGKERAGEEQREVPEVELAAGEGAVAGLGVAAGEEEGGVEVGEVAADDLPGPDGQRLAEEVEGAVAPVARLSPGGDFIQVGIGEDGGRGVARPGAPVGELLGQGETASRPAAQRARRGPRKVSAARA